MELTVLDRSNYLKGLLILIGKDKNISETERNTFLQLSKLLGFNKTFCEDAINELLENQYIIEEPPIFSNLDIAKAFIKDGMRIAFSDKELHLYEMNWLKSVGDKNSVPLDWRLNEFESIRDSKNINEHEFEISKLIKSSKF